MIESKTIKINLKELIEDFIFAYADKNEEMVEELQVKFKRVYNKQAFRIRKSMIKYITNHSCAKDNIKIIDYFNSFPN